MKLHLRAMGCHWPYGINKVAAQRVGLVLRRPTICSDTISVFNQASQTNSVWPFLRGKATATAREFCIVGSPGIRSVGISRYQLSRLK